MDRLLFGDNQFFGVNHMSEEKARAQAMRFRDTRAVIDVIDAALDEGIRSFMCTTHERIGEVCDHVRANPARYKDYVFYPCMPYAHKYNNAVAELGMLGALNKFLPSGGLVQGGMAFLTKDVESVIKLLIDAEMKMFEGLNTPVIFLQNVVVDFLMGLGFKDAFRVFAAHARERYNAEPGFITMNLPPLLDLLEDIGIENPIVCANINKMAFRMCGGREAYEQAVATRRFRPIAMSVFASGALPAREALEYVCRQKAIRSIVFGASSRSNIRQTRQIVDELDAAELVS